MSGWLSAYEPGTDVHVLPVADVVEHPMSDDCVCDPTTEAVQRADGSYGWIVVHHSLDGREATE